MIDDINRTLKFTDSIYDSWYLRTVFLGNIESVASYKHWFWNDRKVRGTEIRYKTDIRFCFEI